MTCDDLLRHSMTFYDLRSWFSQVIKDGAYLASGEILAMIVIVCCLQLSLERRIAVDPAHQMVGGDARVAVGEVEQGKLLFAVTTDFHNDFV